MKKTFGIIAVACALSGCLLVAGCSSEGGEVPADTAAQNAEAQKDNTAVSEESAAEASSKYEVTIDDATVGSDYEGNPALIVTYSWVNNSEDATSAMVALHEKCFQDGVQLDSAVVIDGIESGGSMNEVKPGAGTTYQKAYALEGESDVTIEVKELLSFSDAILAEKTVSVA